MIQDNTIADQPVVELVTSLSHMLDEARQRVSGGSLAQAPLNQLVLIVSDGRFHEKETLRRVVAVGSNPLLKCILGCCLQSLLLLLLLYLS